MRRLRPTRFGTKISAIVLLASAAGLLTMTTAFLAVDSLGARSQLRNRLTTLADVVGQNSNAALSFNDAASAQEVMEALRAEPQVVAGCLYDAGGALFAEYQRDKESVGVCPRTVKSVSLPAGTYSSVLRPVTREAEVVGALLLTCDLQDLQRRWRRLLLLAAIVLAAALLVGLVSGALMQNHILKPVHELAKAMRRVRQDQDFAARVPAQGEDEIADLGHGFNTMLAELETREKEKKRAEERLQYQALNDELTGLPNRRLFADRLAHSLAMAERKQQTMALLYIDLDGFKLVNDTFGHAVGDILLRQVASRLKTRVRLSDTLARIGGDEFTVALEDVGQRSDAIRVANQILEALATAFLIEEHKISIGASIGISLFPQDAADASLLFQQADSAMYASKRAGKNNVSCYTPELGSSLCERMNLETELRGAAERGEITIHYQPEFDVTAGGPKLIRFEALARWTHPTLGSIPPSKFIPIAEESGVIVALGAYILECACRDAAGWQSVSKLPVQVAVNVSSIQFARKNFVEDVLNTLKRTGLAPALLQLELTESVMLNDSDHAIQTLMQLSGLGISLAIDDFGTGYSSLSYLQKLPFNSLKIDRSFVKVLDSRPEGRRMVDSLINLAHNLNMRVIAEGVERKEQMEAIRSLGGDEVQGYLLGKPTSSPEETILMSQELETGKNHSSGEEAEMLGESGAAALPQAEGLS